MEGGSVLFRVCARKGHVRDRVLESRVRQHIIHRLPQFSEAWDQAFARVTASRPVGGEHRLVHLAELVQCSRIFARLLGDEYAETAAVALETLLTLMLDGEHIYAGTARKTVLDSAKTLRTAIRYRLPCAEGVDEKYTTNRQNEAHSEDSDHALRYHLVESVHKLLSAIGDVTAASAYGGPCVAFPVQQTAMDESSLHLRGFDFYRIEMEGLALFLLEIPWEKIEEHPNGLYGLLKQIGRNGHVFDARAAQALAGAPNRPVLRVLYGSALDPDFLEALLQIPAHHIHPVNPILVRRYRPSWGLSLSMSESSGKQPSGCLKSVGPGKSVEELTREYTLALNRMFAASRTAPRDENLPDHFFIG